MITELHVKQAVSNIRNKSANKTDIRSMIVRIVTRLFCSHDYDIINQFEMESEFDIVTKSGKIPNTWNSQKRIAVTDLKCKCCTKFKRLKVVTPK